MQDLSAETVVGWAQSYPFDLPIGSYTYRDGREQPFEAIGDGRRPIVAIGSNAAPSQLRRKLGLCPEGIPVTRALLRDHAVVYAAHFTAYGSLPATLAHQPGSVAWVFVTWLSERQIGVMHESEGVGERYALLEVEAGMVEDEQVGRLRDAGVYVSRSGALVHRRHPIRLAEIPTLGCRLPALTQRAALRWAHARLAPGLGFTAFVYRLVIDAAYRRKSNAALPAAALDALAPA
jgi:hypothetical protein